MHGAHNPESVSKKKDHKSSSNFSALRKMAAYVAQDYVETAKFLTDSAMQGLAALSGKSHTKLGRRLLASALNYTDAFARRSWDALSGNVSYAQYHAPTGANLFLSRATAASLIVPVAGIVGVMKARKLRTIARVAKSDLKDDMTKLGGWASTKVEEIKVGARLIGGGGPHLAFERNTELVVGTTSFKKSSGLLNNVGLVFSKLSRRAAESFGNLGGVVKNAASGDYSWVDDISGVAPTSKWGPLIDSIVGKARRTKQPRIMYTSAVKRWIELPAEKWGPFLEEIKASGLIVPTEFKKLRGYVNRFKDFADVDSETAIKLITENDIARLRSARGNENFLSLIDEVASKGSSTGEKFYILRELSKHNLVNYYILDSYL